MEFLTQPRFGTGTSLAAPIVAARVVNILQEEDKKMELEEVRKRLSSQIKKGISPINKL